MINLTTAFSPGDVDAGKSYTHVKVVNYTHHLGARLNLSVMRGYLDEGAWTAGGTEPMHFRIDSDEYTAFLTDYTSTTDEKCEAAMDRALHQWLIDKEHFAGTIA